MTATDPGARQPEKLAELIKFSERAALIERSGIQFMDFGLKLDVRKEAPGEFALKESKNTLARLEYQERDGNYVCPGNPPKKATPVPRYSVSVEDSFKLLCDCWLPLPYLRAEGDRGFSGPTTWARGRVVVVAPEDDLHGHSHRLTLAFDTNVIDDIEGLAYLAPTKADVQSGASFRLAHRAHEIDRFIELPWVIDWLAEIYRELAPARLRTAADDLDAEVQDNKAPIAHYLNWLSIIGERAHLPEVVIRSNARGDVAAAIPVDMVLDVGNSRTCGILVEEHPQQGHGLKNRYELALRDLSRPHCAYVEPFESRVEFAQVILGKEHCAAKSGRNDAFIWPTIARVGPEAARLANQRRGTEGSTGLSSPKRYLWDEDSYQLGWRFNVALSREEIEPHATGAPFSNLINDVGTALYTLDAEQRMPVFMPHYSRSAMMTFMLAEVLTQALVQINSPGQRLRQGDPEKPRHLRSIILTVPPSMPKPERDIFASRMDQAMVLVWKSLGWHGEDIGPNDDDWLTAWPPFPQIHSEWDEATCAQVVYLFSECQEHFAGRPEDFFQAIRRPGIPQPDGKAESKRVTFASIDIGGGTTDLVVTDYVLDDGQGANVYIIPEQRFRDGFKVAGDDLLLEVVEKLVIPAIETALRDHGVAHPTPLLSRLIGSESISVQEAALRQQLALQILYPLGLHILKEYEKYDPVQRAEVHVRPIAEMLEGAKPSAAVLQYFATGVRQIVPHQPDFDLTAVKVTLDLYRLHRFFLEDQLEICKTIQALCEIVWMYNCDMLLLSGRPSRLPGIQALFRLLLALPPDRILPLDGYRTGTWYPFHKDGRIADPKTTAAVGAMVCKVGGERSIPNFNLLSNAFRAYSTVRYIGLMDSNMRIKDEEMCYSDVHLDDENYDLPKEPFEVRGRMVLGFRQLASERWGASPLYLIDFPKDTSEGLASAEFSTPPVLLMELMLDRSQGRDRRPGRDRRRTTERFAIKSVAPKNGPALRVKPRLKLNTLNSAGLGETNYWLDSGSVIR